MYQSQAAKLTLISHRLCPYVQRAVIALEEQQQNYRRRDVDLENPPGWFKRLSPLGKVPLLLQDDEAVLFESAVIAEYINDIGGGRLLADSPLERAQQRAWIEFASATLDRIGGFYSAVGEEKFRQAQTRLEDHWRQLEAILTGSTFFSGESLTLVDAAYAPVFRYLDLFEQLLDIEFLKDYPKLASWRLALSRRQSVIEAVGPDYPQQLAEFIAARDSWLASYARAYLDREVA